MATTGAPISTSIQPYTTKILSKPFCYQQFIKVGIRKVDCVEERKLCFQTIPALEFGVRHFLGYNSAVWPIVLVKTCQARRFWVNYSPVYSNVVNPIKKYHPHPSPIYGFYGWYVYHPWIKRSVFILGLPTWYTGWWFGTFFCSISYMGCHPPHLTFIFFRGVETTNQYIYIYPLYIYIPYIYISPIYIYIPYIYISLMYIYIYIHPLYIYICKI